MRAVGAKRPRELFAPSKHASVQWTGRVPKPAMNKDSWVDYGSGFLRKSCDSCVSSKRRCDGQDPCTRCLRRKKPCHYTERKKCGPRSGQKAKCARASSATLAVPEEQKLRAHSRHPTGDSAKRAPHAAPAPGESMYSGLRLGASLPPSQGTPSLAAGDLSGETTGVDFTDCSDTPPSQHMLARDESGGSWWSLEDQAKAPESASCPAWVHQRAGCGRSSTTGYPNHDVDHLDDDHLRKRCRYGGRWEDAHEATGGGSVSGGSGGSGCETSEDDGSEESLGQAEEEVAALLIHLWRSEPFVKDVSGKPSEGARSSPAKVRSTAHVARYRDSERCWDLDDIHGEGRR